MDVPYAETRAQLINTHEINTWDITNQLKRFEKPLTLLYADKDIMVTPKTGEKISSMVKGECNIEILHGTHTLLILNSKEVLKSLIK